MFVNKINGKYKIGYTFMCKVSQVQSNVFAIINFIVQFQNQQQFTLNFALFLDVAIQYNFN